MKEKEIAMPPVPLRGNCEKGKVSTHREVPSLVGRSVRMGGVYFVASEESTVTGLWKAKQRETSQRIQC